MPFLARIPDGLPVQASEGGPPLPSTRAPRARTVAWAAVVALVALAVLVHLDLTRSVDEAARQWARPDDVWGPLQMRVDTIVEGLRPTTVLPLAAVVAAAVSLVRRSPRPLFAAGATVGPMLVLTIGTKLLLHRPDPHGALSDHGGSFPSGHTVTVVVCTGILAMMLVPGRPRWRWVPALLLGTLMALSLLVQAAHWLTDVVGGGLLGVAVLATATALGADEWFRDVGAARPDACAPSPDLEGRATRT